MTKKQKSLDRYYRRKYGITYKKREVMLEYQGGACALCLKKESCFSRRLAVDHNHKTGQVRGLLCFRCNKFLVGRLTTEQALMVYNYLKSWDSATRI